MKIHIFMLIVSLSSISSITNLKQPNKNVDLTPARYKVANKPSNDASTKTQFVINSEFPEVEYPTSVVDSSKPYYSSLSPFPDDVKAAFDSLLLKEIQKTKPSEHHVNYKKQEELVKPKIHVNNTSPKEETTTVQEESNKDHNVTQNNAVIDELYSINDKNVSFTTEATSIENLDKPLELKHVLSFIEDLETVVAALDMEAKMENLTITKFDDKNLNLTDNILEDLFEINENMNETNTFVKNVYEVNNKSLSSFGD